MNIILILALISVFIDGFLKGVADTIQHDPKYRENGWKAKWALGVFGNPLRFSGHVDDPHWWYFGFYTTKNKMIERFPLSSTALSWLTDKWHLMNFIRHRIQDAWLIFIVVQLSHNYVWLLLITVLWIVRGSGFHITYK